MKMGFVEELIEQMLELQAPTEHQHNYSLKKLLGKGSFGTVWKATDKTTNKDVAIKQICERTHLKSVLAEVSNLKGSIHVNIPKFYECFQVDKGVWLVMEYIKGLNLAQLVHAIELSLRDMAAVCHGVLSALSYLHSKKIIHRDVKGQNILVHENGNVYLADLGCSIAEKGGLRPRVGTLSFMAPEIFTSVYCCKADVWSLGMTLVQMLTRQNPNGCNTKTECFDTQKWILEYVLFNINEDIPEHLENFLGLCLEYDPEDRPSASALLEHEFILAKSSSDSLAQAVEKLEWDPDPLFSKPHSADLSADSADHKEQKRAFGEGVEGFKPFDWCAGKVVITCHDDEW